MGVATKKLFNFMILRMLHKHRHRMRNAMHRVRVCVSCLIPT